jgi:hypothetical protein
MKKSLIFLINLLLSNLIVFSQDDKQIVTKYGFGKNCQDAEDDALNNAIRDANVLYSYEEKIINEQLFEEIRGLGNVNFLKKEYLEGCKTDVNGQKSIQLKVTLSKLELSKFINEKNNYVSFEGNNLNRQKDQELVKTRDELLFVRNKINTLQLLNTGKNLFDNKLEIVNSSVTDDDKNIWKINAKIIVSTNKIFENTYIELLNLLNELTINKTIQEFRSNTNIGITHPFVINSKTYFLRNEKSIDELNNFHYEILSQNQYVLFDGCEVLNYKELNSNDYNGDNRNFTKQLKAGIELKTINISFLIPSEKMKNIRTFELLNPNELFTFNNDGTTVKNNYNKYSNTNPEEYDELKKIMVNKLNDIAKENDQGKINFKFNIKFSNQGINESYYENLNVSEYKYSKTLDDFINQNNLTPSKRCNDFIYSTDTINFNFKWNSIKSNFLFLQSEQSKYSDYFRKQGFPNGKYLLIEKNKELNNHRSKIIYITNYKVRGPLTAFYSLIIPGWGSNRVTYGDNSGKGHFALVIAPIAISFLTKAISNAYYSKYLNSSDPTEIERFYQNANAFNKTSVVFKTIGATFYLYDFIWVINKGFSNISKKNKINEKIKSAKYEIEFQDKF